MHSGNFIGSGMINAHCGYQRGTSCLTMGKCPSHNSRAGIENAPDGAMAPSNGLRGNSFRLVASCLSKIPDEWSDMFCKTTWEGSISSALKATQPRCGCHCTGLAHRRGGFEVGRGAIPDDSEIELKSKMWLRCARLTGTPARPSPQGSPRQRTRL
jgi:hypothetical protein